MRSLDWNLRTTMIHEMIACYCEAYFSMLSSWWFDSDTLISQFPTFSATIMIISHDNDILIFDMNSVIKIISRYYHSIITKISAKYQNINNQTNDILSWYFDKPQYCTLVILFDAEPAGSTRFSPLWLFCRRKEARSFLAGFRPDIKKIWWGRKLNLRWNNQIENGSRAQIKYHTAIRITYDNWRWILISCQCAVRGLMIFKNSFSLYRKK